MYLAGYTTYSISKTNCFVSSCNKRIRRMCLVTMLVLQALLVLFASSASSDVSLPDIFNNGMVLQRGMMVPVWGTAGPGEKVTVTINGNSKSTTTSRDGSWSVKLNNMKAGGPFELIVKEANTVTFSDIKIGDVWLCSGQSNMWWPMKMMKDIPADKIPVDNPDIRLYSIWSPEHDLFGAKPEWSNCTPDNLGEFSAVAYFFGRELQHETGVTVGLIHSSMGGSVPETWMLRKTLSADSDFRPIVDYWDSITTAYPAVQKEFAEYLKGLAAFKTQNGPEPVKPDMPFVPKPLRYYMRYPQGVYDAQLKPLIPFAIKGVVWYQGESSTERAWQYRRLFPAMIDEWRGFWGQGDFPFIFVQLQNYNSSVAVAEIREAQFMTLAVPKTGMAVTVDIGDSTNVHANNKWDVGTRLALSALHVAYGRDIPYSGPLYSSMQRNGSSISIAFDHVEDGLVAANSEPLKGFEIAGEDRKFHNAQARIDGARVTVTSENVTDPVAVRYGWRSNPTCNLYNSAALPASPFRTDDWEESTYGRLSP